MVLIYYEIKILSFFLVLLFIYYGKKEINKID